MVHSVGQRVLVIDDDDGVRGACVATLRSRGYQVSEADRVASGLAAFAVSPPSVVVLDLKLPDGAGLDVLKEIQRLAPGTPVLMISGFGSVSSAVDTLRAGAADFLEKPFTAEQLVGAVERVGGRVPPSLPAAAPDDGAADGSRYGMVGRSAPMRRVYQLVEMAAPARCRVLITGERGTGKELIARAIHSLSPRRERPFVQLNCAAIPSELIESELFGHVRGAFTGAVETRKGRFEAAHKGTLFLDEVGDMSPLTQVKLLRTLQEGEVSPVGSVEARTVDVRILAATSRNLLDMIANGAFREDLYDRINVLHIALPPLRSRREDIPELAVHYLRLASVENGFAPRRLAQSALEYLTELPWRGNVRELRNLTERLVVLARAETVERKDVLDALQMEAGAEEVGVFGTKGTLRDARRDFERMYVLERLEANGGNPSRAAADLGIERTNLYRKLKQLGIALPARRMVGD